MATLQHPLSFVAAKHKSGHSRVNRCGLMGLASRDFPNEFKKSAACVFFIFFGCIFGESGFVCINVLKGILSSLNFTCH